MSAIADISDLVNRATGGSSGTPESIWFTKQDRIAGATATLIPGRWHSLWMFDGQPGGGATPPTTAAAPDNTTAGSLKQTDPGGGRQKWLTSCGNWHSFEKGVLCIYDRLLHISGLSGTVTSAQTVGGSITRYTGTEAWGNEAWFEIYTQVGATAVTATVLYTDQDGNASSTTHGFGATNNREQARATKIPLAAGDSGVRGVTSVQLLATTGTAGDFGITIARPLLYLPINEAGGGGLVQYLDMLNEIKTGACLALAWHHAGTIARARIGGCIGMLEA